MAEELNEQSTKEEITAYVEQVAQEAAVDREGEKGDARITAEHADNEEKQQVADTTAPEGEDTGPEESTDTEWLNDDIKAEAAAYGMQESDLADFASREEWERALRLFDKSALEAGRKTQPERNEKGQFVKKEEQPEAESQPASLESIEDWDDIVTHFDRVQQRITALESRLLEAEAIARERQFDALVDSLGHADLFGKTDRETPKEKQRRQDLLSEVEVYLAGRAALGRPTDLSEIIVSRIARSLFAEELGKKELKQRTRKVSRQSDNRQGGGATRPQDPREDPRDEFDRLYRQLSGVG